MSSSSHFFSLASSALLNLLFRLFEKSQKKQKRCISASVHIERCTEKAIGEGKTIKEAQGKWKKDEETNKCSISS